MDILDCRGLACPQPVIETKDALEKSGAGRLQVLVDNEAARDNVARFARSQGCQVEVEARGSDYALTMTKTGPLSGAPDETVCPAPAAAAHPRLVVKFSSAVMGAGDSDLGRILMKAFIKTLAEATLKPKALVFYNAGVTLVSQGSEHLEALTGLAAAGVDVLACGACLDFYRLKDKLAVGRVTNMFEIIETLSAADRVVSP
jgi:selenium metabolism protein YedF